MRIAASLIAVMIGSLANAGGVDMRVGVDEDALGVIAVSVEGGMGLLPNVWRSAVSRSDPNGIAKAEADFRAMFPSESADTNQWIGQGVGSFSVTVYTKRFWLSTVGYGVRQYQYAYYRNAVVGTRTYTGSADHTLAMDTVVLHYPLFGNLRGLEGSPGGFAAALGVGVAYSRVRCRGRYHINEQVASKNPWEPNQQVPYSQVHDYVIVGQASWAARGVMSWFPFTAPGVSFLRGLGFVASADYVGTFGGQFAARAGLVCLFSQAAPTRSVGESRHPASPEPEARDGSASPSSVIASAEPQSPAASAAGSAVGMRRDGVRPDDAPMVLIPAGEFTMGSTDGGADEKPTHVVSISAFYLEKYEVTFDLYDSFCEATGRTKPSDAGWGRGSRPVINVSWSDASAYAAHCGKRLPTEAEWEYACRAGGTGKWCFGDDEKLLGDYAWFSVNSGNRTHPVGQKKPNAWGLYDMHGNAWEWCADRYDAKYYARSEPRDPPGPLSGDKRVRRGGPWDDSGASWCRSASRGGCYPEYRYCGSGFRCAMSVAKAPER